MSLWQLVKYSIKYVDDFNFKRVRCKKVTAKAQNDYHAKILNKIGADTVVHPERDMGRRIAHNVASASVLDYLELADEHSIVELKATEKMAGSLSLI